MISINDHFKKPEPRQETEEERLERIKSLVLPNTIKVDQRQQSLAPSW